MDAFGGVLEGTLGTFLEGVAELYRHQPRTRRWRYFQWLGLTGAIGALLTPIGVILVLAKWPDALGTANTVWVGVAAFVGSLVCLAVGSSICARAAKQLDTKRRARFDQQRRRQPLAWAGDGQKSRFFANTIIGKSGKTLTPLQPGGKVEIDGHTFEATSQAPFIEAGVPVTVIDTSAFGVVVRPVEASPAG